MQSLKGKIALVTGAGVRLGRAIAETLSGHGCRLLLHCNASKEPANELARQLITSGGEAVVLQSDLSKASAALQLARDAHKIFGKIDILVNSAAVFWPTPLARLTEEELDSFYAINLKAPYILSAEIGQEMKRRGGEPGEGGAILNMACLSGLRPWKTHLPYSMSKAGIISLTRGMAKMLAPEVRVNAIAPGSVLLPENFNADSIAALRAKIPLKKIGSPTDIVDAAIYLLSAPFVTGQILCVDGGRILN